ncbi:radical SAM additional 4Fe4S-binding SPASM domain protein [Francisella philomiragia]|uniref:radical SAM/SPASM domain-containing protein n=1 Tax=Francisella philomiragia TaxID=28110 RepID=UPI0005A57500|nr:radical SAM protein [Francisella philomiragia]AJI57669.1 radical SAM additional 4Fe4S-binding SPASM domain protein [Francisella philomiragia]
MKHQLKWMAWETTRRCNLKCVHCRSSSECEVVGHPDFSSEEGFRIIDNIVEFASPVLVLSGGEPLLRADIFELAKYGANKGLRMALATNGSLVTDEICEKIKNSMISIVSLSIDGATAETHDDFRSQKGAFEATVNAAKLFKKHGIPFLINSSFTKRNQHEIKDVYKLAKSLEATAWYLFMIVPTGRGEELMQELIDVDDYQEILNWHYDMEADEQDMLVRPTCAPHYYRIRFERNKEDNAKVRSRALSFGTGGGKGCIAGQSICLLDVDGNVYPCSYLPVSAGNVKEKSFADIWQNSDVMHDMRDFSAYEGKCGSCEFIKICGGCRARAYNIHGSYLAEEPFCNHMPIKLKQSENNKNK